MERITSRQNPLVSHMRQLGRDRSFREQCGEYVCDGGKLLGEALKWGAEIVSVLWAEDESPVSLPPEVRQCALSRELLDYVSPLRNCPGVLFSVKIPERALENPGKSIVLETVQDPGNLGTVLRTANALGMDSVILTGSCADLYNPKTVRAAMGALFRQRVMSVELEKLGEFLDEYGIRLFGASLSDRAEDIRNIGMDNIAVAIGSEGSGLSRELLDMCEGELIIPMRPECESLNAAVAAAIIMWELTR